MCCIVFSTWQRTWIVYTELAGQRQLQHSQSKIHYDGVIKWNHFPRYWPFAWGIHRSPVGSPHKGQWRGALMFSLICAWINGWVNNREAGDLRRHRAHHDITVMKWLCEGCCKCGVMTNSFGQIPILLSQGGCKCSAMNNSFCQLLMPYCFCSWKIIWFIASLSFSEMTAWFRKWPTFVSLIFTYHSDTLRVKWRKRTQEMCGNHCPSRRKR